MTDAIQFCRDYVHEKENQKKNFVRELDSFDEACHAYNIKSYNEGSEILIKARDTIAIVKKAQRISKYPKLKSATADPKKRIQFNPHHAQILNIPTKRKFQVHPSII